MLQEPEIVLRKESDVSDVAQKHRQPFDPHPPSITRIALWIDIASLQNVGMNHPCAENLQPPCLLADPAASPFARNAPDVDFKAGLHERKIGGAIAGLHLFAKELTEKVIHRRK